MARPKKIPPKEVLSRYLADGLTQGEMVDRYLEETEIKVSRSLISVAMTQYGLEAHRVRHDNLLPWTLRPDHRHNRNARYLRLEARRRKGEALPEDDKRRLGDWLTALREADASVYYDPDSNLGFWWVKRYVGEEDIVRRPQDAIPWEVRPEHEAAEEFRLLNLEVRRLAGETLAAEEFTELRDWLTRLDRGGWVVDYDPEHGFSLIAADDRDEDIARRRREQRPVPDGGTGSYYCVSCRARRDTLGEHGECPVCGSKAVRLLGKA